MLSAAIVARDSVPVVVRGDCVEASPVPITMLVTVPVPVIELHPKPVPLVQIRALEAPLQDGIAKAVGTAPLAVPFPTTVFAEIDGKSPITIARNAHGAAPPEVGPAANVFAVSFASTNVNVPALVTGDPDTVNSDGAESPTDVTVPLPEAVIHDGTPVELSAKTCVPLLFPAKLVQPDGPRYIIVP